MSSAERRRLNAEWLEKQLEEDRRKAVLSFRARIQEIESVDDVKAVLLLLVEKLEIEDE